jgi:hypothetical protein
MPPEYIPRSAKPGSLRCAVPLAALVALAAACSWPGAAGDSALSEPALGVTEALSGGTLAAPEGTPARLEQTPTPAPYNLSTPAVLIERPEPPTEVPPATPVVVLPSATIRIFRPGPGSQVTSPFQVYGRGGPSFNERVGIRLVGEDGRLISERLTYLLVFPGRAGNFVAQLEFQTPRLAEAARLEVYTEDLRYGRMAQLASMDLVLLSRGSQLLHPQIEGPEKLAIFEPRDGALAQGGLIAVRGAGWVDSDLPLTIELLDRAGQPLASQQVPLVAQEVGQLGTFEAELQYQIPFSQYGRVVVYETSAGIPGMRHYSSVEVWLQR